MSSKRPDYLLELCNSLDPMVVRAFTKTTNRMSYQRAEVTLADVRKQFEGREFTPTMELIIVLLIEKLARRPVG
jgi:hypothetical protein